MKIDKSTTDKIDLEIDLCVAEATVKSENGKILSQEVRIEKSVTQDKGRNCMFWSDDYEFIKDVHKALGEYIQHVEGIMRGVTPAPHENTRRIEEVIVKADDAESKAKAHQLEQSLMMRDINAKPIEDTNQ